MAAVVEPIKQATSASPGLVVETSLQPGHVLDRIGLVDGVMLYPVGTLLRERSLPPDALDGGGAAGGLHYYGVRSAIPVRARVVDPGDALPHVGHHLVGQGDQVPLVDRDPRVRGSAARMPEA